MIEGFMYVFKNYVYVPISLNIASMIVGLLIPKIWELIVSLYRKLCNSGADVLYISGKWNFFSCTG